MTGNTSEIILDIPSDYKYLGAVDAAVQDLTREFAFSEGDINDVSTALIEACSNAIEHGNRCAPEKRVTVTLSFNGKSFTAVVRDQGRGFDYEKALADDSPPDTMSERGRGIMIMRAFMDRLGFSRRDDGFTIELVKIRGDDGEGDEES